MERNVKVEIEISIISELYAAKRRLQDAEKVIGVLCLFLGDISDLLDKALATETGDKWRDWVELARERLAEVNVEKA